MQVVATVTVAVAVVLVLVLVLVLVGTPAVMAFERTPCSQSPAQHAWPPASTHLGRHTTHTR